MSSAEQGEWPENVKVFRPLSFSCTPNDDVSSSRSRLAYYLGTVAFFWEKERKEKETRTKFRYHVSWKKVSWVVTPPLERFAMLMVPRNYDATYKPISKAVSELLLSFLSPKQRKKKIRAEAQTLCWQQQLGAGSYCSPERSSCLGSYLHRASCSALTHRYLASPLLIWGHSCKPRYYCPSFIAQWQGLSDLKPKWRGKWCVVIKYADI